MSTFSTLKCDKKPVHATLCTIYLASQDVNIDSFIALNNGKTTDSIVG